MTTQLLKLHWKAVQWILLPITLAVSIVPLATLRVGPIYRGDDYFGTISTVLGAASMGVAYPVLAVIAGSVVALTAWTWDHEAGHVYALSLPITRAKYAAQKFWAGLVILAVPAAALLLTTSGVALFAPLPDGVRAYPGLITFRFAAASATLYALFFALAAGRKRTALIFIGTVVTLVVLGLFQSNSSILGAMNMDVQDTVLSWLTGQRGPMAVFANEWTFLDV